METIYDKLQGLQTEFETWSKANNLSDDYSADDLLYSDDAPPLDEKQRQWLLEYIERWKKLVL